MIVANMNDAYLGAIGGVTAEGWERLVPSGILPLNMPDLSEYYHTNTMDNLFLEFNLTYKKVGGSDTILGVVRLPLIASNIASYFYIGGAVIFCRPSIDTDYIEFTYGACTVTGGDDAIEIGCRAHVTKNHDVLREYHARNARVVKY